MHYIKQCLDHTRVLNHKKMINNKIMNIDNDNKFGLESGMIELQLTDKCNLKCHHCHFREEGDYSLKKEWIDKVVNTIKPNAISLAGGGEPTLYPDFSSVVKSLKKINNGRVQIGLITNGVFMPKGDWQKSLEWLRVSLYSINNNLYCGKNKLVQDTVIKNIEIYLNDIRVKMFGVHLLYYKENIIDCIKLSYKIYQLFLKSKRSISDFNIQFKLAFNVINPHSLSLKDYYNNLNFIPKINDFKQAINYLRNLFEKNPEYKHFLNECTNYHQFKNYLQKEVYDTISEQANPYNLILNDLSNCYVSLAFSLITPDGHIYTCPSIAEHRNSKFALTHIDADNTDINKKVYHFYNCNYSWCNKRFCRHYKHNILLENNLNSEKGIDKDKICNYPEDYFF